MSTGLVVLLRCITIWLSGDSFGSGHWIVSLLLVCAWLYLRTRASTRSTIAPPSPKGGAGWSSWSSPAPTA